MKAKHFLILIDALRHDYITERETPYLYSLKRQSVHAEVIETFAFQTRPAYFAGLEPEESNICHLFRYDPEHSPFSFLKPFTPLLRMIDRAGCDRFFRGVLRRIAASVERTRGNIAAAEVMSTERIPLHLLPNFALSELIHTDSKDVFAPAKTLFDELRDRGLSWEWIGYPRHFGSCDNIVRAYREASDADLYYLHFSELDWIGHRYGPESDEIKKALRQIDDHIATLLTKPLLSKNGRAVIFGDHGMAPIHYQLDIESALLQLPYRNGEEYLAFFDSTQVRFWFFDKKAEEQIVAVLNDIDGGHILTDQEREALRIRFKDRSYGDIIFMLDGAGLIHPSFFSKSGTPPKGMHGYLPGVKENMTQIFGVGAGISSKDLGTIPMREMYPLIKSLLLP